MATVWAVPAVTVVAAAPAMASSTMGPVTLVRRTPSSPSLRAFGPGEVQMVAVTVQDVGGVPVVGRVVTFSVGSSTWLRLIDAVGDSYADIVVATDDRGVAVAPLRVVAGGGATATVVATVATDTGAAQPVSWNVAAGTRGHGTAGSSGGNGRFSAAHADGRAYTWGTQSGAGQLGNGTATGTQYAAVPVQSGSLSAANWVLGVAAGDEHVVAVSADGAAHAWGRGTDGRLGTGDEFNQFVPAAVNRAAGSSSLAGRTVVAVAAGAFHSLALASDGTVHAWGRNSDGQLGDGSTTARWLPVQVARGGGSSLAGKVVVAIATGNGHSVAVDSTGVVHTWGRNSLGQLGRGSSTSSQSLPGAVVVPSEVGAVAAGANFTMALTVGGAVFTWGTNSQGQLGSAEASPGGRAGSPVPIDRGPQSSLAGKAVTAIAAGGMHAIAVASDGTAHAWGWNNSEQLGWGGTTSQSVPGAVSTAGSSTLAGRVVVAIAGMRYTSLALTSDGGFHSWGADSSGDRGDGDTAISSGVPGFMVGIG